MPNVVNIDHGAKPIPPQGPPKPAPKTPADPEQKLRMVVIGAGAVVVLLLLFLVHTYITPITPSAPAATKVAPPPGYPDQYPYNTKEWQQQGHGNRLSGVPPVGMGGPPATPGTH